MLNDIWIDIVIIKKGLEPATPVLILRAFHIPPFSVSVYIVLLIVYFMQYSRY